MAVKSGFFMSVNGDRKYDAAFFAEYFASFIGNGIFPNLSTNLQVVEGSNMQTIVKPGKGWINGYYVHNDSDFILQHDIADGVLKRIDRIVLQWNYLTRQIAIVLKKGTFASNPVAPVLQRDTDYHELALADVLISNGTTQITQANITDLRLNKECCGIVHGLIDQVDSTELYNQYLDFWNTWKAQKIDEFTEFQIANQSEFDTWFDSVKGILEGDVAANLTTQISVLSETVTSHKNEDATLTQKGHVQLSSAIDSESESMAATSKAVKTAYDRAEQAFTQANDIKTKWANVVGSPLVSIDTQAQLEIKTQTLKNILASNLTSKGQSSVGSEPLETLIEKVGNIATGKRYVTGITQASSGLLKVLSLPITPSVVVGCPQNANTKGQSFAIVKLPTDSANIVMAIAFQSNGNYVNVATGAFGDGYFNIRETSLGNSTYNWIAFQ